jgi:LysR family transcriptional activator of nhaA
VASQGSIKSACKLLNLTQPTISAQIKTLEEDLGFHLFYRKHRKLELTPDGEMILKKAERIFRMGEELINTLPNNKRKHRNEIRLGAVLTLTQNLVHDFAVKAWKDPEIKIQIKHDDHRSLIEKMDNGKIDIILSDTPQPIYDKRFDSVNIGQEPLIAVGAKKFIHLRKSFPFSLSDSPFLSFGLGGQVHSEIEYFFKNNNIKPDYIGSVDDINLIQLAAEKGHCVALLPASSVKKALKDKLLINIGSFPEVVQSGWAITTKSSDKKLLIIKMVNNYMVKKRNVKKRR